MVSTTDQIDPANESLVSTDTDPSPAPSDAPTDNPLGTPTSAGVTPLPVPSDNGAAEGGVTGGAMETVTGTTDVTDTVAPTDPAPGVTANQNTSGGNVLNVPLTASTASDGATDSTEPGTFGNVPVFPLPDTLGKFYTFLCENPSGFCIETDNRARPFNTAEYPDLTFTTTLPSCFGYTCRPHSPQILRSNDPHFAGGILIRGDNNNNITVQAAAAVFGRSEKDIVAIRISSSERGEDYELFFRDGTQSTATTGLQPDPNFAEEQVLLASIADGSYSIDAHERPGTVPGGTGQAPPNQHPIRTLPPEMF